MRFLFFSKLNLASYPACHKKIKSDYDCTDLVLDNHHKFNRKTIPFYAIALSLVFIFGSAQPSFALYDTPQSDLSSGTSKASNCYTLTSSSAIQTPSEIQIHLPDNSNDIVIKEIEKPLSVLADKNQLHFFLHGTGSLVMQYNFTNLMEQNNGVNGLYHFPSWYVNYWRSANDWGTLVEASTVRDENNVQTHFCVTVTVPFTSSTLLSSIPFTTTSYSAYPQKFYTYDSQFHFNLDKSPDVCEFQPLPNTELDSMKTDLIEETNYALIDWQEHLTQGKSGDSPWKFTWRQVPLSQQNNPNNYQDCNIIFYYKPFDSPDAQVFPGTGGITNVDQFRHKAIIEIFYGSFTKTTLYGMTIRHEFGHALGLGHYVVPDEELARVSSGSEDYPSIMFPAYNNGNDYSIQPVDVQAVYGIYGNDGFGISKIHTTPKFQFIPDPVREIAKAESGVWKNPSSARMLLNYLIFYGLIHVPSTYDVTDDRLTLPDNVTSDIIVPWINHKTSDFQFLASIQNFIDTK